jgi:peptidoglycan/LPS O-acetylase OafA/YrhL
VVAGVTLWLISFSTHPDLPDNYFRVAVEVSLANLTVFALVAAITEKGSGFERIFSVRWACWLGTMSYGLYVYHFTYHIWFANSLRPQFSKLLPDPWDYVATAIVAFAVTLGLGILSYRLMEQPILSLKKYFNYGPVLKTEPARKRTPIRSLAPSRN